MAEKFDYHSLNRDLIFGIYTVLIVVDPRPFPGYIIPVMPYLYPDLLPKMPELVATSPARIGDALFALQKHLQWPDITLVRTGRLEGYAVTWHHGEPVGDPHRFRIRSDERANKTWLMVSARQIPCGPGVVDDWWVE